ncbi:MAG: bifunctional 3,4-dihydroxy-2-butanone-4-phosphate synthase/GTP cyclohydrolase II [Vampirovibrionales bacterium]
MTLFNTVEEALEALQQGRCIVVADDEDRENEGDLIAIADLVTDETINFMASEGRGLICLALTPERCQALNLHQMVPQNSELMQTAFTVSVDAKPRFGVTTGISAKDRATTIRVCMNAEATPNDLARPGHIFPLRSQPGGVLQRVGHTEAAVDLARLAGFQPAGVICEIMNPDGTMALRDDLAIFAQKHNLPFITVAQLVKYRLGHERFVKRVSEAKLPTHFGEFTMVGYENTLNGSEHVALVFGDVANPPEGTVPLVRVHSECLTGDLLGSLRCDCGFQLHSALRQVAESGCGAVVYLRQHEGRGIGLLNKVKAYALQDEGMDTVEANHHLGFKADLRDYGMGAQIILDLGIRTFNLLTNNPRKIRGLDGYGLAVNERVPLIMERLPENFRYLQTKQDRLGHLLDKPEAQSSEACCSSPASFT